MNGGAWQATVHGVTKSRTRLTLFIELNAIIYIYSCSHFYGFKKKIIVECFHDNDNIGFFFFLNFLLYNTVLVLLYIDMNLPWVYMSSQT